MADRRIGIECDDRSFFSDFFDMFGGPEPTPGELSNTADVQLEIHARTDPDFGWFRKAGSDSRPIDAREYSYALEKEGGNFELLPASEPGWTCIAFRDTHVPAVAFHGSDCLFALGPRWRLCIIWYLFWHLLRIRSDAIFFHASALGIYGEGTIFVGPGGGGKSTTSLALAARGHNFLSDEIAGYVPVRGELIPFRRPVGIKPGPRCNAVQKEPSSGRRRADQGAMGSHGSTSISALSGGAGAAPVPLRRIVFLARVC